MAVNAMDFAGRVALITGGRRGIGRGIAFRLAASGAAVVLSSQFDDEEGLSDTVAAIKQAGGTVAAVTFDVALAEQRADAIAKASRLFGPIDILVNNAYMNSRTAPSEMNLQDRRHMFEVNFHGPIDLIQQSLPHMRRQGWGRILNITSESARQPPIPHPSPAHVHGQVIYGATKIALERYTFGLAAELHGTGILVNAVYPYRVCVTETPSEAALAGLRLHPDWAEPVEMMAEAAMVLIAGGFTGVSLNSRQIMQMVQQPLHALDGTTIVGDACTLADLGPRPLNRR